MFAEGGTGKPEQTRQGLRRVVRPKKSKALRFPAPPGWRVPVGSIVYAKYVKGWEPQHLLRDTGACYRPSSWAIMADALIRLTALRLNNLLRVLCLLLNLIRERLLTGRIRTIHGVDDHTRWHPAQVPP